MPEKLKGNMMIGQSGGPTMVVNSTLVGAIREAEKNKEILNIYGALNGLKGVLTENLIDLKKESADTIEGLVNTPAAALGSVRLKMKEEHYQRVLEVFKAHNVRYFFYIGGNDSMDTANKVASLAEQSGYEMRIIGIPKTIDNDLLETDHCPGYGSAAKMIIWATQSIARDNECFGRVHIIETMGRYTGWLAASSVVARRGKDDAPHLIFPPEKPFYLDKFLESIKEIHSSLGHATVVLSEGLKDEKGELLVEEGSVDQLGHPRLGGVGEHLASQVNVALGITTRFDKLGTLQRSFMPCVSETDLEEAFRVGQMAVHFALEGANAQMVSLVRKSNLPYICDFSLVPLEEVANDIRLLPEEYISAEGNDIDPSFGEYVEPLIRGDGRGARTDLPHFHRLHRHFVEKKLPPYRL